MKRALLNVAAGLAAAFALVGATSMAANANYLGYGNGDPGDWDLWTEQAGGPPPQAKPVIRHYYGTPRGHAHLHQRHHRTGERKHIQHHAGKSAKHAQHRTARQPMKHG